MLIHFLQFCGLASALLLATLLLGQAVLVMQFLRAMRRRPAQAFRDDECPTVLLVLCLRGADPFLRRTLTAVGDLDYLRLRVRIVVDSPHDPAWPYVRSCLAERPDPRFEVIERRSLHPTAGLKCSSLLDAVEDLDPAIDAVALLDADVIPHRAWLRELVAPLAQPEVGVACGNRWYVPGDTVGSKFRYLWNAPAVVLMHWTKIAWGGSLAIRASLLRRPDLPELWSRTLCEDTPLEHALREAGLRMQFVPSLLMLNRESCTLRRIVPWVRRQLLIVRLYHPAWPVVYWHGLGTSAALATATATVLVGITIGESVKVVAWTAAALIGYLVGVILLLWRLEVAAMNAATARGEAVPPSPLKTVAGAFLNIPLTQLVYVAIVVTVPWIRRIEWRGVYYSVAGRTIRLIQYHSFTAAAPDTSSRSL